METVFGMNFFVFCFCVLFVVLYFSKGVRDEGFFSEPALPPVEEPFGTSPGTMVQLASSRVHTAVDVNRKPDQDMEDHIQSKLTEKALLEMTGSGSMEQQFAPVL
jgi:hypothetical protein